MKLKIFEHEGKQYAHLQDGKPVVMEDDGKEIAFDIGHTRNTITRLNGESKNFRERAENAEGKLKGFEGIEDAESARKALETVRNIKEGDLIKAGQVEEIKAAAKRSAEETVSQTIKTEAEKRKALEKERDSLRAGWDSEKIGGAFKGSKYISEKIVVPPDMIQATFGRSFKVEDGKIVAMGADGKALFSNARPGEIADFDEAIETLVHAYPYKDQILKGSGSSGSGARQSNGQGDGKSIPRAEFNKMNPLQQREFAMQKGASITE